MKMRSYNRTAQQTRPITLELGYTENADGSVLVCFGKTKVICTASLEEKLPAFLQNGNQGWVTAEYGMLPGATHTRFSREASRGKQSGRTLEISRMIARSLRTCVDMTLLGERSITVDCDVIQADGGTRTASITGGCVALQLCLWKHRQMFENSPMVGRAAAVSLGIVDGHLLTDLDYQEDSHAEVDLNLVMDQNGKYIEIQGTAEGHPFTDEALFQILKMGRTAIAEIGEIQVKALGNYGVSAQWAQ